MLDSVPYDRDSTTPTSAPRASYFPEFVSFLTAQDLQNKGAYHRFAAAYRVQLVTEWLRLTGHRGLFLYIDEMDNVIRQIHGKALPACFRTLAWYCSCPELPHVRVAFAGTPEILARLDRNGRRVIAEQLNFQAYLRPEEVQVYGRWNREAEILAADGWAQCSALRPAQRVELFERIAEIHRTAWGRDVDLADVDVVQLARQHQFDTTRRWVRATVQLLDLLHQKQHPPDRTAQELAAGLNGQTPQEAWQMPLAQWRKLRDELLRDWKENNNSKAQERLRAIGGMTSDAAHRARVKQAIEEKKPVPDDVRADYPDL
jgi:hypothetical protein